MKNKRTFITIVLIVLVVFLGFIKYKSSYKTNAVKQKMTAYLKVDGGNDFSPVEILEGTTALELTKDKVDVKTTGEGGNAYVISINGKQALSSNKEYWAFYINGKLADVGAGSYKLQPGDKIEWKVETY